MTTDLTTNHMPPEHLTALLDDELPPADADRARAHLAGCASCRREWESLAAVRNLAFQWTVAANADLWPAVQTEIVQDELRQLRAEMQALRQEVAHLRRELAARPPQPSPPRVLLPYSPSFPAAAARRIV